MARGLTRAHVAERGDAADHGDLLQVPAMGVLRAVREAVALGFRGDDPDWCNLGQGQPELGSLPGAPRDVTTTSIAPAENGYAPVEGLEALRAAVADYYNRTFRRGRASRYTAENVAITPGGRAGLARLFAVLAPRRVGCFSPDYAAYVDLFRFLGDATPVSIELSPWDGFALTAAAVEAHVSELALDALVLSNPCNPTGRVTQGAELAELVAGARRTGTALVIDEFYSHYVYRSPNGGPVSAAAHVADVDRDPVILVDGLTKGLRRPGWRLAWVVGPSRLIDTVAAVGSFLDGGAAGFVQRAAIELLDPERLRRETEAVRAVFARKRDDVVRRLRAMGLELAREPDGAFYAFPSVAGLPAPLDTGQGFARAALGERVIVIPGDAFDMTAASRAEHAAACGRHVRISFGPPLEQVATGLDRLERMIGRVV